MYKRQVVDTPLAKNALTYMTELLGRGAMDMNDRQLRFIVDGLGGKVNGTPREDGFDTVSYTHLDVYKRQV